VAIDGEELPLYALVGVLNERAGSYGIGRIDMIENRAVGIKSRELYEAPAALALIAAHRALEDLVLTKGELEAKRELEPKWAKLVYDGGWFAPVRSAYDAFFAATQELVTGDVRLSLQPGAAVSRPVRRRRAAAGLGGIVLYGRNVESPEQLAALTGSLHAERPELLVGIDEEGGDVTRLEASTGSSYPGNLALGVGSDVGLTRAVAASMGAELAAAGVDLDLAPDADVNSNPDNPVIGVRSFGSDPRLVSEHVAAFVEGLQGAGVAACAKHFPGHGDTSVDSHLDLPVVNDDPRASGALEPFRAAIAVGVRADT